MTEQTALSAPPAPVGGGALDGELLCRAFTETFNGGGWTEPFGWNDYDDSEKQRWNVAAEWLAAALASPPSEGEGLKPVNINGQWFVKDGPRNLTGPYSSRGQAEEWIGALHPAPANPGKEEGA